MKILICLFAQLFICLSTSIYAIENLKFEHITDQNGLSHNTVRNIIQDKQGFMWFGTLNGINRYDGSEIIAMFSQFGTSSFSVNSIKKIMDDKNGYIWILSGSGLIDCYDIRSESLVNFKGKRKGLFQDMILTSNGDVWLWGKKEGACRVHHEDGKIISEFYDISNLQTNQINFIFEDSKHQIWVATNKGLFLFYEDKLLSILTNKEEYNFRHANEIGEYIYFFTNRKKVVIIDKQKTIRETISFPAKITYSTNETATLNEAEILITSQEETFLFQTNSKQIIPAEKLFSNYVPKNAHVLFDNRGDLWLFNKSGNIWQYIKSKNKFKCYNLIPPSILSLIDLERYSVCIDSRGIIWISTYGNGLFAINPQTNDITHLTRDNSGLKTNYLLSVYEGKMGEIWVGTEYTGVTKILLTDYQNKLFLPGTDKSNVEDRIIRSVFQDKNGDIWIGTKRGNLYVFDEEIKHLISKFSLTEGIPYCIVEDSLGDKWIGTKGGGLLIYSKKNKQYKTYLNHPQDSTSLACNYIYSIIMDSPRHAWVGTFGEGLQYAEKDGEHIHFRLVEPISSEQKALHCMLRDRTGKIWIGGNDGILIFDPQTIFHHPKQYQKLYFDQNNPGTLNQNEVKCLFEDSRGQIWIGTSGGGLNLAIRDTSAIGYHILHYTTKEGLINNVIQSIEEDNNGNLWISTENGISKLNIETKAIENYNFSDIWESNLFNERSSYKRVDGKLMFGCFNGLYILNPSVLHRESTNFPIYLTKLLINGTPAVPNGADSPLCKSITETNSIQLKHGQNAFGIVFSSLNYLDEFSRYTYILENYDKEWNPITRFNIATYKNVPAGKYTFRVKSLNGSNNEKEAVLDITVLPPFWKSPQAIILYIILALTILFFVVRLIIKMNNLHNAVVVEKRLTEYRLRFFTNISHEFRTPLTIIRGSIESMNDMKGISTALKEQIKVLEKSSSRLMRLIDQLLEFRKLQKDKLELNLEKTEAVSFFADIYNMFSETAQQKGINYTFSSNKNSKTILLDRSKMDKVAYNLLSNAFKYTPQNGNIVFKVIFNEDKNEWLLNVADSGIGIPADKRNLLFKRFAQINYTTTGIGIGLNLVYEFVTLHNGQIKYTDSQWGGASFNVTIPMEEASPEETENYTQLHAFELDLQVKNDVSEDESNKTFKAYKLLIIEDDEEIRSFLANQLKGIFNILTASDGREGLDLAIQEQPNLIICDVMMPQMNGFEVTKYLKADFNTSHIPIILLTAHSSIEHQVEGIEAGADAYIVKPFSTKYLKARVIKLIEQREKLQHKFSQEPGIGLTTISTTEKDKAFIEKINNIINKNLDNTEFNVEEFARTVGLGRTMLYKKVKGITGYAPNEYLNIIRIKKAAELLITSDLNVSEIAYQVGFNDPYYFSRCFKDQFSISPLQYRKQHVR